MEEESRAVQLLVLDRRIILGSRVALEQIIINRRTRTIFFEENVHRDKVVHGVLR